MADPVQCYVFHCRGKIGARDCRMPTMLPVDAFESQFPNRAAQPTDDCPVALVCWHCKCVRIYSPHRNSPYYDPFSGQIECAPTGETECLSQLGCEGGNSEFRAPLFVTWIGDTTAEEKIQAVETWNAAGLRAADGCSIYWPWKKS